MAAPLLDARLLDGTGPQPFTGTVAESLSLAVAPSTGRFRPTTTDARTEVATGDLLGHVTGGRGRADEVRAPAPATVRGFLARAGQLVLHGQPLVWLERAS